MNAYKHLLAFALDHPWNLTPSMLTIVANVLAHAVARRELEDPRLDAEHEAHIRAAITNRRELPQPRKGSVAIIPVHGVLAPRTNLMSDMSGGTTYEQLSKQLQQAVGDSSVHNIVLDIDSPGGSVAGNAEFAREVMAARAVKPIIAQAHYTMASAAYQIAAAATQIHASPSAQVGGIGTYSIHNDLSQALAQMGVKRTYISAGTGKVDGNEAEPLTPGALDRRQHAVDQAYSQFVNTVVLGRGGHTTDDKVRNSWQAHVYGADDALDLGLIDRVSTLDQTIARLLDRAPDNRRNTIASDDTPQALGPERSGQDRQREWELEQSLIELAMNG